MAAHCTPVPSAALQPSRKGLPSPVPASPGTWLAPSPSARTRISFSQRARGRALGSLPQAPSPVPGPHLQFSGVQITASLSLRGPFDPSDGPQCASRANSRPLRVNAQQTRGAAIPSSAADAALSCEATSAAVPPPAPSAPSLLASAGKLLLVLVGLALMLTSSRPALAEGVASAVEEGARTAAPRLVLSDITRNSIFMSAFLAWAMAQSLKVVTHYWTASVLDFRMLFASGGMPSSHSAMCCGLTAAIVLMHGFQGPLFPIALAFTLIVMYDATSVRYHAGVQAQVLNVVVKEMLQGHPVSEQKLKEILGHTPLQVAGGASLGIVVACLYHRLVGLV